MLIAAGSRKYVASLKSQIMHARIGIEKGPKSTPTLREFRKKFLDHCKGTVAPETYEFYRFKLDCGPLSWKPIADSELGDINEDLIDQFVRQARKKVGVRTVNHYLRTLRKALKLAKRWGVIKRCPDIVLLSGETSKDYRPTPEDKSKYLAHAARRFPDLGDIAILGFETGGRLKEMRLLRMDDVHIKAEGSLTGYVHYRSAEKDPSNRHVPLTDVAREMLERRLAALASRKGRDATKFVFPSPRSGARPIAHETVEGEHLTVRRELEMDERFTVHSMRHEFCSRLGDLGAGATAIMKLAGHSSLATSQKYVHMTQGPLEAAIMRMNVQNVPTFI